MTEKERRKKYRREESVDSTVKHNYPTIIAAIIWLTQGLQQYKKHKPLNKDWFQMLFAIVEKFFVQIWREKFILLLWIFLPVITLVITCACIGPVPEVAVGIINEDSPAFVSNILIENLDTKIFKIQYFDDPIIAKDAVDTKQIIAYFHF